MTTSFVCVLRSGGEYNESHVHRLQKQVLLWNEVDFICLSDQPIDGIRTIPLLHGWPRWWSKMELFRPDLYPLGKIVYMDLDTTIVGDLTRLLEFDRLAIMRDVYRRTGLQSSIMVIPEHERDMVWKRWIADPEANMVGHDSGGDQEFLETVWLSKAVRLQDWLPGLLVSYKADRVAEQGVPDNTSIIVHHGKPRPWEVGY
jgi:hypothetical protein